MPRRSETTILWMSDEPMLPGRPYLMKIGATTVQATVTAPKYRVNVNTMEHIAGKTLDLNAIGVCNIALDRAVAFDAYAVELATEIGDYDLRAARRKGQCVGTTDPAPRPGDDGLAHVGGRAHWSTIPVPVAVRLREPMRICTRLSVSARKLSGSNSR